MGEKKKGKRPITNFKALYRVWGRCREAELSCWEKQLSGMGIFNSSKGRKGW